MKKVYSFVLSALALLAFVPAVKAQVKAQDEPVEGIEYSKTISKPDEDGIYTITLESYVTGSVQVKSEPIPADIVLVLDVSSSMSASRGTTRVVSTRTSLSYDDVVNSNTNYLYNRNGTRYQLSGLKYNNSYYLYYCQPGNGYRFLQSNGSRCSAVNTLTPPGECCV